MRYFTLVAVAYEPEIRSLLIMVVPVRVLFDGDRVLPSPKVIPQAMTQELSS